MTELGDIDDLGAFDPRADAESAGGGLRVESTNVCRAAAFAMLLRNDATNVSAPLVQPLEQLGFSRNAITFIGGADGLIPQLTGDWFAGQGAALATPEVRQLSWEVVNDQADPFSAVRFLVGVLGSPLEQESAAAAAALWQTIFRQVEPPTVAIGDGIVGWQVQQLFGTELAWDPETWQDLYRRLVPDGRTADLPQRIEPLRLLVLVRLGLARASSDPVTRSLARALNLSFAGEPGQAPTGDTPATPAGALVVSTMVHGTWGWKGDWWRPKGGFHQFIAQSHRPNLYARGARYSWSGAYSQKQRIQAAEDLVDWTHEVAPNGLQTLFGHSYGGEVAAMAAMAGATTQELVLLSVPGTGFVNAAAGSVARVIDVRTPFDPVLAIANTPQRLAPASNLNEVLLPWYLRHGASHDERVWMSQDVAGQAAF